MPVFPEFRCFLFNDFDVVNVKSAIEWVMERYAITTHKESGIRNDPNDWAAEVGNPLHILDLPLSVIQNKPRFGFWKFKNFRNLKP